MSHRVAFVGLGVMGYPMAGHLSGAGHAVTVFNRTRATAERWCLAFEGKAAKTPAEAARSADFIFVCVGNDADVEAVMRGPDGILSGAAEKSLIVDHTTASAGLARELHADCLTRGIQFLDAPVSGGQAGAEKGALSIMIGGDESAVDTARPIMEAYAARMTHVGESGAGQLAKMVNQICIAGIVQGLAEGLHFAKRADLDVEKVIAAISGGAAQSWQMDNRWKTMRDNEFEFGFAVDWMRKDLRLVFDEARQNGATLELTELVDRFYADVQTMGGQRWDTSSLIARLEKDS